MDDAALVKAYIAGEEGAFSPLVERHRDKVFTTIYLIVKDREIVAHQAPHLAARERRSERAELIHEKAVKNVLVDTLGDLFCSIHGKASFSL